jgi:hypothetical protein
VFTSAIHRNIAHMYKYCDTRAHYINVCINGATAPPASPLFLQTTKGESARMLL